MKMNKIETAILSTAIVVIVALTVTGLGLSLRPKIDIVGAEHISNAFISDLQAQNVVSAFHLESLSYQKISNSQPELNAPQKYVPTSAAVIVGSGGKENGSNQLGKIVYKFQTGSSNLYIAVSLQKVNGLWQVYGFSSSRSPINASS